MKEANMKDWKLQQKVKLSSNIYGREEMQQLKSQNHKLKKQLKESQAKRSQITKQCSEITKQLEFFRQTKNQLEEKIKNLSDNAQSSQYPIQQLKFLNRQLSQEIQQLRNQNRQLNQQNRYTKDVLERKYQELENKTLKRMQQSMKRVKNSVHYLNSMSSRQIEKTKQDILQNLNKAVELLKGKCMEGDDADLEIQQLMNPLKCLQQQAHRNTKEINKLKQQNQKLQSEVNRHKKIQKQLLPQYKQAIEKLKRNLGDVRSQLAQNQYDKNKIKTASQEQIRTLQAKYNELYTQFRKTMLENQIYKNKMQDLQEDVEQEKQRLIDQNNILKKLYQKEQHDLPLQQLQDSEISNHYQHKKLKKNHSNIELKRENKNQSYRSRSRKQSSSGLNQESSLESQQSLKNQILKIDEEIVMIQQTLAKQLDMYR